MKDVFIVGTGGLAREVSIIVNRLSQDGLIGTFCGFISADINNVGTFLPQGRVVASDDNFSYSNGDTDVVIALGVPKVKSAVVNRYTKLPGLTFPNIISPNAHVDLEQGKFGYGNIICHNAFTSCNVNVGNFCLINWNVTIGHDANIGSCSVVNPGAHISGYVTIGVGVLVGAGACVLENICVDNGVIIGAGAVVTKDLPLNVKVAGVPAREIC